MDPSTAPPLSDDPRLGSGTTGEAGQRGYAITEPQREPITIVASDARCLAAAPIPKSLGRPSLTAATASLTSSAAGGIPPGFFDLHGQSPVRGYVQMAGLLSGDPREFDAATNCWNRWRRGRRRHRIGRVLDATG